MLRSQGYGDTSVGPQAGCCARGSLPSVPSSSLSAALTCALRSSLSLWIRSWVLTAGLRHNSKIKTGLESPVSVWYLEMQGTQ